MPVFNMALSRARPMRNSRERSGKCQTRLKLTSNQCLTVYTLWIRKGLVLLCLVPFNHKAVSEGQCCARVCCSVESQQDPLCCSPPRPTYASSQLKSERARDVSTCRTTSVLNSSLVLNSVADCCEKACQHCFLFIVELIVGVLLYSRISSTQLSAALEC